MQINLADDAEQAVMNLAKDLHISPDEVVRQAIASLLYSHVERSLGGVFLLKKPDGRIREVISR